ncbi:MAG TPA: ABC transporter permease [Candidatus Binatia bacterium]
MLDPIVELWRQRRLIVALVSRDLRTRYAGSTVGLVWAVASPLLQIVILTLVFSYVLEIRLGGMRDIPFPVVLAWGIFPWIAFQEGTARATTSLVESGVLIKRMAFRPGIVAAQPVLAAAVQLGVALTVLVLLMPLLGVRVAPTLPLCLVPLALQIFFAIGIGWILGVLHVYFRDTAQVVVVALQAWFYLTPIVYTLETAPQPLQRLLALNPLCGIVESYRAFALGGPMSWGALGWSAVAAAGALSGGAVVLSRARDEVADLV